MKNWTLAASAALLGLTAGCGVMDHGINPKGPDSGHPWAAQWNVTPPPQPVAQSAPRAAPVAAPAPAAAAPAPARVAPAPAPEPPPAPARRAPRASKG